MSKTWISVIIPCYNTVNYVGEAIDSAYAQASSLAIEVIVIDNVSTDGSWEELARLKRERYPDLQILCHPDRANLGVSASRYRRVLAASGTYVAFLDADDVFFPGKLEAQLQAMEANPEVVLCHTAVKVIGDESQAPFFEAVLRADSVVPYNFRAQKDYLIRQGICNSSAMVRAEALKPIRFAISQLFQFEDWLCWCLLAARGPFLFLDQPLVGYRVHEHASTAAVARSRIRHLYALLEFKIALFARCESGWHGLRVRLSVLESLRLPRPPPRGDRHQ
jgi:glycosyltransferase involved in cell wall biosynthesis